MSRRVIESNPWKDQHQTVAVTACLRLSILSIRSRAALQQGTCSQDYVHVAICQEKGMVAFCLCDGVGSSFAGQIAARYLARHLPPFLLEQGEAAPPKREAIERALHDWASAAAPELASADIPPDTSTLVAEVIDELRRDRSSETVFLAGLLYLAHCIPLPAPVSTANVILHLYTMGNIRGVIVRDEGPPLGINAFGTDVNRWAVVRGSLGTLDTQTYELPGCSRIWFYTDGLEAVGPLAGAEDSYSLFQQALHLRVSSDGDDMAMLELRYLDDSGAANAKK